MVVGYQEVHISKQPKTGKRVNECPVNMSDFTGTRSEKHRLKKLLVKYDYLFSKGENDVSYTDRVTHCIELTNETPIKQPYRCAPPAFYNEVKNHL